jgi:hypothetical protein
MNKGQLSSLRLERDFYAIGEQIIFELLIENVSAQPVRIGASRDWTQRKPRVDCREAPESVTTSFHLGIYETSQPPDAIPRMVASAFLWGSDDQGGTVLTLSPREVVLVRASDSFGGYDARRMFPNELQTVQVVGGIAIDERERGWLSEWSRSSISVAVHWR